MSNSKTYFILPTTDYQPDDLIKLGQVIPNPREPYVRLAEPLPLEGPLKPRISSSRNLKASTVEQGDATAGVFARAVDMLTAEASRSRSHSEAHTWQAATLETQYFEVADDPSYVERTATELAPVREWLRKHRRLGKTLYMVTGLKIVRGPGKAAYGAANSAGFDCGIKATLDPGVGAAAVQAGVEAGHHRAAATVQEAIPEESFVFAYRLRKIRVVWRNKLELREYRAGGNLYGVGSGRADVDVEDEDDDDDDEQDDDSAFEMEKILVEQDDFGEKLPANDKRFKAIDEDDGSSCLAIPVAAKSISE